MSTPPRVSATTCDTLGAGVMLRSFHTSASRPACQRSSPPRVVATHTSPSFSAKSARAVPRASAASRSVAKPVKRTPSNRTTPSAVATHR